MVSSVADLLSAGADILDEYVVLRLRACIFSLLLMEAVPSGVSDCASLDHSGPSLWEVSSLHVEEDLARV